MPSGQKHLVKCTCILPQFRQSKDPPQHRFTVFSIINDDDTIVPKVAQCPNCGVIHRVTDIGVSIVVHGKDASSALITLVDVKGSTPEHLRNALEANNADLPTWEAVQFAYEQKNWQNDIIVLSSEEQDGTRQGKYMRLLSDSLYEIKTFSRNEVTT